MEPGPSPEITLIVTGAQSFWAPTTAHHTYTVHLSLSTATENYNYVWRNIIPLLYYEARLVELLHTHLFLRSTSHSHLAQHSVI